MSIEAIVDLLQALLTPLIAIIATYIAWQQAKTNRDRLTLERYDRRLRIYEEVKAFLSIVVREANVTREDLLEFRRSTFEADFLFDPEIPEYIEQIYTHGLMLHEWSAKYRDCTQVEPEGYDHEEVVEEKSKEFEWLSGQLDEVKKKFGKYLCIGG